MADPNETGSDRRRDLLDRVVDHVLEHGVADLTLRGLSAAVGSNNRMLLYYFGSRDELIITALEAAGTRFPSMQSLLGVIDDATVPLDDRLDAVWRIIASPENLPYHRLFFQIFGLAGFEQERFTRLLDTVGTEWAAHVAQAFQDEGVDAAEATVLAHQVVALWRGLQATLISTGDLDLVNRAAAGAIRAIRAESARRSV
jgi:AcrR family transcriptional regulator